MDNKIIFAYTVKEAGSFVVRVIHSSYSNEAIHKYECERPAAHRIK